ncbi:MetQ/NlpA family ABC transporter substrate-binding protein [Propionicicella superfundia]|uniref:MetQ/NlpA family ABC transporter substrate-binding protein n=1 Tax=Propionicicella superfundia TaxID=348582 RepID=UPI00042805BD|nr:MetQ/NlpA family ABC transporter substrate-binding protein [Propionicicella superfundia]
MIRRLRIPVAAAAALLVMTACSASPSGDGTNSADAGEWTTIQTAARYDYDEVFEALNAELESEHIKVVNTAYDTSINLNELLLEGDIDINVAQHRAYLSYVQASDAKFADLTSIGDIHISTLDLYSEKYDSVDALPDGATVAIPNDVLNGGRALLILAANDVIGLDTDYEVFPTVENINSNPSDLEFEEIPSDTMVRTLEDVDAGFVYSINAVDGGLDPTTDPILKNGLDFANDPFQLNFVIVFTVRGEDKDDPVLAKVVDAYHSDRVARVYKELYAGSLLPVNAGKLVDLSGL